MPKPKFTVGMPVRYTFYLDVLDDALGSVTFPGKILEVYPRKLDLELVARDGKKLFATVAKDDGALHLEK